MNKPSANDKPTGRRTRRGGRGRSPKRTSVQARHTNAPQILQNRHLLLLTGATGTGKTELLQHWKNLAGGRMVIMDPLESNVPQVFPDHEGLEMVAIDHADWLPDAPAYVRALSNWAQKRGVLLLLSVERESWLHAKGIELPSDPIHVTLNGQRLDAGITLTYLQSTLHVSREELDREITAPLGQDDADVDNDEETSEE